MKFVKLEFENDIASITLNRPEKRNAFHAEMILEITKAFENVRKEGELKAVVLKAEGPSFCSGGDLDWMKSMKDFTLDQNLEDSKNLFRMFEAAYELDVPLIGKAHGHVMGGAIGLIAVCDIAAAETQTQFCFSEVKWGLVPAVISPFVLRKMRKTSADQMMLSAKVFHSDEALQAGLLQFQGSQDQVDEFVNDHLKLLSQAAPTALRETKKLLKKIEGFDPKRFLKATTQVISERRVSAEGQKGLGFFLSKQKPDWSR